VIQIRKRKSWQQKQREWFLRRLSDITLVDRAVKVYGDERFLDFAVPVGETRRGGYVSCCSIRWAKQVYKQLFGKAGFPSLRIEYSPSHNACHTVRWGEQPPDRDDSKEEGRFYGYREEILH
jgi:hypothetical protein